MSKRSGKLTVRNSTPDDFNRCFPLLGQLCHGDIGHNFKEVFNKLAGSERSCVIRQSNMEKLWESSSVAIT